MAVRAADIEIKETPFDLLTFSAGIIHMKESRVKNEVKNPHTNNE